MRSKGLLTILEKLTKPSIIVVEDVTFGPVASRTFLDRMFQPPHFWQERWAPHPSFSAFSRLCKTPGKTRVLFENLKIGYFYGPECGGRRGVLVVTSGVFCWTDKNIWRKDWVLSENSGKWRKAADILQTNNLKWGNPYDLTRMCQKWPKSDKYRPKSDHSGWSDRG